MYTALHLGVEIDPDTPTEVLNALQLMLGVYEQVPALPDHPLFQTPRWRHMLICDSYYFDVETHSELKWDSSASTFFLTINSNFKNYNGELDLFLDWISPHVREKRPGDYWVGYWWYEEDDEPSGIYHCEGKLEREIK